MTIIEIYNELSKNIVMMINGILVLITGLGLIFDLINKIRKNETEKSFTVRAAVYLKNLSIKLKNILSRTKK